MDTMNGGLPPRALGWVNDWLAEDVVALEARASAEEAGVACVDAMTGATLRWLAHATCAKAIVEIGTGVGVSTLHLARGMVDGGVLTSIDPSSEHQRLAKAMLSDAGFATNSIRLIAGRALEVMPRLTDGGYDLVLCDGSPTESGAYLEQAGRLLRPGGVVALVDALGAGLRVTDPAAREPEVVSLRAALRLLIEDERWTPTMLPLGSGLLVAAKN